MITASNLFLKYGDRVLLDKVDLVIGEKDKIGLVGRNGAGKSTLLKIIAGEITPDQGGVTRPSGSTLGFLHQEMEIPKGKTVMEETLSAFDELKALEQRMTDLNEEIARRTDYDSEAYHQLLEEFAGANDRFHLMGGHKTDAEAEKVLKGLGFAASDFQRLVDEFSGGWQMRIVLAKMLLQRPDFLLLDEPTNHLDIESIIWLEGFLRDYQGAVVLISHDREFLDNVTKRTVEIELGRVYDYKAPYSAYVELRKDRREKMQAAFENQQRVIAEKERTINRFMAKASKTRMAQSMQKQLDRMERIEIAQEDTAVMNIKFPPAPRSGQVVVDGKGLTKKYGDLLVLDRVDIRLDRGDRIAFVGQNGQGKTTLAKIIVNELTLTSGDLKLGHNVQVGYYAQNQSDTLHSKNTVLETMEAVAPPERRTQIRNILGAFMFSGEDVDKKVTVLSGGERARLALACLLLRPFNLLVLDEPTNHLDMLSKDVLKRALMDYDGALVVVSHDREFLGGLTNRTLEFRDRQLHDYLGDVNYFLEKRRLNDMRQVELSGNPASGNGAVDQRRIKREVSFDERKRLLRAVSNAEKKVERLEKEVEDLEKQMADPAYYESDQAQRIAEKYQEKKRTLEEAMEEWEEAQLAWEEVGD